MGRIMKNGIIYADSTVVIQPVIYSEEEREIGVWTDGKPLYEKTVVVQSPQTGYHEYQHGVSNVDKFVYATGMAERTDGEFNPIPTTAPQQALWGTGLKDINGTRFALELGTSVSYAYCYVTLRYTKTTDQAGSGTWTPQGVLAVHYSTSEQVVGTWVDGKTVYERTIIGTTTDSTNAEVNKVIFDGAGFVDKYISVDGTLQSGEAGYDNQVLNGYVNATNHVGFYKPSGGSKEVKIYYNSSAYPSGSTYVAIIRYTKSTS